MSPKIDIALALRLDGAVGSPEPALGQAVARGVSEAALQVAVAALGGAFAHQLYLEPPGDAGVPLPDWRRVVEGGAVGLVTWAGARAIAETSPLLHGVIDGSSAAAVGLTAAALGLQWGVHRYGPPSWALVRNAWLVGAAAGGLAVAGAWWRLHALGA